MQSSLWVVTKKKTARVTCPNQKRSDLNMYQSWPCTQHMLPVLCYSSTVYVKYIQVHILRICGACWNGNWKNANAYNN